MRRARMEVPFSALAALLRLPPGVEIRGVVQDRDRVDTVFVEVGGEVWGYDVAERGLIPVIARAEVAGEGAKYDVAEGEADPDDGAGPGGRGRRNAMTPDDRTAREIVGWLPMEDTWAHWEELARKIVAALAAEREACCRVVCGWCAWKGPIPTQGLAAVSLAEAREIATWTGWQHRLTYRTGEERWVDCDAQELRARGAAEDPAT